MQDSKIAASALKKGVTILVGKRDPQPRTVASVAKKALSGHFGRSFKNNSAGTDWGTPQGGMTSRFVAVTFEDGATIDFFPAREFSLVE
jgi:hypothetical protein